MKRKVKAEERLYILLNQRLPIYIAIIGVCIISMAVFIAGAVSIDPSGGAKAATAAVSAQEFETEPSEAPWQEVLETEAQSSLLQQLGTLASETAPDTAPPETSPSDTEPESFTVQLVLDGVSGEVLSAAKTVGEFLEEQGLTPGPKDYVSMASDVALYDGICISLIHAETVLSEYDLSIAFETEYIDDESLYEDEEIVENCGVAGVRHVVMSRTLLNGIMVESEILESAITKAPVNRVVRRGTLVRTTATTTEATTRATTTEATTRATTTEATTRATTTEATTEATTRATTTEATTTEATTRATTTEATTTETTTRATTTEATTTETIPETTVTETTATEVPTPSTTAPETTEATEDTTATEPAPAESEETEADTETITIDGVVYNIQTSFKGRAVAYYSNYENPLTFSGRHAVPGHTIAVDPSVIPLGSIVYITSYDGTSWTYGPASADDTGGGIRGTYVDLFMSSYEECVAHGNRQCIIYIITPAE